ncbi:MAG: hypothetical protein ACREDL_25695 [Bradyrhizobium sp.]
MHSLERRKQFIAEEIKFVPYAISLSLPLAFKIARLFGQSIEAIFEDR